MKTIVLIFLLPAWIGCTSMSCFANDTYAEIMAKNIQAVYSSQSIAALQAAVNTFERIAAAEKNKWEPYYYAGFGYVMMANIEKEATKKDGYLDQALAAVKRAKDIQARDSEIIALEGFIHMIRVTIDPASRGQQYSGLAMQSFGQALSLNPHNPRALALMAQMQYGTAQFFASSTAEACATNEAALEKFSNFKSDNPLGPQWGKGMAEQMKAKCKE